MTKLQASRPDTCILGPLHCVDWPITRPGNAYASRRAGKTCKLHRWCFINTHGAACAHTRWSSCALWTRCPPLGAASPPLHLIHDPTTIWHSSSLPTPRIRNRTAARHIPCICVAIGWSLLEPLMNYYKGEALMLIVAHAIYKSCAMLSFGSSWT